MALLVWLGYMERTRGVLITAMFGIASGVGFAQMIWPPRTPGPDDTGHAWDDASTLQKAFWVFGGCIGALTTAVLTTIVGGNY